MTSPLISPVWLEQSQLGALPDALTLDWLFDEGSLTRRLTAVSNDHFSVSPLFEGWQTLREDECRVLELPAGSLGWVREVCLRGHQVPWVFARSVASKSALEAGGLNMDALGTRSLGELLFSDQAFERGPLQVCRYPRDWLPDADRTDNLWARRSRFMRGSLSVLVAEVFLPNLWAAVSARPETN
ncbi:chorismate--pyruvate lyase family protein [Pseudomonas lundensis]|uniref:chorismate--pyruvate lyase family protein n=1 Tax=Pseudomonas lundensis TaxID=86185 RepID=UPI000AEAF87A|nr:chorismate lyase [Pseudomonas lundensis]